MDLWELDDHDNGWIPKGANTNISGEHDRLYYLHDEIGSVTRLIGENGKTSSHFNYDEFGKPLSARKFDQNWPGPDNTFGYTGYQYDFQSELYYAQARYYMPEIGRFISEDPWPGVKTVPTTMNPYPYVLNNPLKYVDPLGLSPWEGCIDNYINRIKFFYGNYSLRALESIMKDVEMYEGSFEKFKYNDEEGYLKFIHLVNTLVRDIGDVGENVHYFRNKLNKAPETLEQLLAESDKWVLMEPSKSIYHMYGEDGEYNLKFVSTDGYFEAVYDKNGILLTEKNDPVNMGTYNYASPNGWTAGLHAFYDVRPYDRFGNTREQKGMGSYNGLKSANENLKRFNKNAAAQNRYYSILKEYYPERYKVLMKELKQEQDRINGLKNTDYYKIFAQ